MTLQRAKQTQARPQTDPRRPRRRLAELSGALVVALAVGGCSVHTVKRDRKPPVKLPKQLAGGQADAPEKWWTAFDDTGLNALVERALTANFDVQRAWQRLGQVQAIARQAGAARLPQLSASLDASYSERTFFLGGNVLEISQAQVPVSVGASYEVDLWGRVKNQTSAVSHDVLAARADVSTAAMSVAAAVADAWLLLIEQKVHKALLDEQIKVSEKLLEVVEGRFSQGLVSAVDVLQQRQQLAGVKAQLPLVDGAAHVLRNQLRALLGIAPGAALGQAVPSALPTPPALPKTGLPSELLLRRPDIRAAKMRMIAADHRVGMALAGRFPSLRLSGQAGLSIINPAGDVFTNPVWSVAAGITAPLFNGGRLAAEHDRSKAALREVVLAFGQRVLQALHEVDNAVARETQRRQQLAAIDAQLLIANKTLEETQRRYSQGVGDFLPVLGAVASTQALQRQRISAARQLLSQRVSLHRALGGKWAVDLKPGGTNDGA